MSRLTYRNYSLYVSKMDACHEQNIEEPTWRWDGGFVIITFKRPTNKETIEIPKEIIEGINTRGLTEAQRHLVSLITATPSMTLSQMAGELNLSVDQVRTLRKKMEKEGIFLCRKGATKKGVWVIEFKDR